MGRHSKLRRNLLALLDLNRALAIDTLLSISHLSNASKRYQNREAEIDMVHYSCRVAVRSFFAHMEGLAHFMRRTVLLPGNTKKLGITKKTQARLAEKRYDRDRDYVTEETQFGPFTDRLKLAFRHYPRLFGSTYQLNTNSPTWAVLKNELVPARNRLTHPEHLEDFYVIEAMQCLKPCHLWFWRSMFEMLQSCGVQIAVTVSEIDLSWTEAHEIEFADLVRFDDLQGNEDWHEKLKEFQGRTLEYLRFIDRLLHQDILVAFDRVNSLLKTQEFDSMFVQSSLRHCIRTIVACVEGAASSTRFYILAAEKRGETDLDDQERKALWRGSDMFERLIVTNEIFSRKFGYGEKAEILEEHHEAVQRILRYRDRFTHPKSIRDLSLRSRGVMRTLAGALGWLAATKLPRFDIGRVIEQGRRSGSILPPGEHSPAENSFGESDKE